MAVFKIQKVIGAVPETIEPDCLYLVRTGVGFDFYASDTTGAVAHALNGGAASSINDLLSIPLANLNYFEHAIVIQNGELRRMPYADFLKVIDPAFTPYPYGFIYDSDFIFYDDDVLIYPDDTTLCYGDEVLYYGEEPLEYYMVVPDNAIYANGKPIRNPLGDGYLVYALVPTNAVYYNGEPVYCDGEVVTYGV